MRLVLDPVSFLCPPSNDRKARFRLNRPDTDDAGDTLLSGELLFDVDETLALLMAHEEPD